VVDVSLRRLKLTASLCNLDLSITSDSVAINGDSVFYMPNCNYNHCKILSAINIYFFYGHTSTYTNRNIEAKSEKDSYGTTLTNCETGDEYLGARLKYC